MIGKTIKLTNKFFPGKAKTTVITGEDATHYHTTRMRIDKSNGLEYFPYVAQQSKNYVQWPTGWIISPDGFIVSDSSLVVPELPKGFTQEWLVPEETKPVCDCGSFTTYGSWAKEVHSTWCKVNQ